MHTNHRNKIQSKCAVWSTKFVETFICDNVCINNLYVKHFYSCVCLYKLLYSITDFIVFFLNAPLIKLIITNHPWRCSRGEPILSYFLELLWRGPVSDYTLILGVHFPITDIHPNASDYISVSLLEWDHLQNPEA